MNKIKFFSILAAFLAIGFLAFSQQKKTEVQPAGTDEVSITLYKNPGCQCCSKWAEYMEANGFSVDQIETDKLVDIKQENGIPDNLGACHTALMEDYVIEGHVPVEAVNKLLEERPEAKGIAVPGMPAGSPGMDQGLFSESFEVILFDGQDNQSIYSRH